MKPPVPVFMQQALPEPIQRLAQAKVIPVIRAHTADDALWGARLLIEGGLSLVEITWTVPNAAHVVETLRKEYAHVSVGAGTILSWEQYQEARAAGAQWYISPMLNESLTCDIVADGALHIPAVATPTELYKACLLGIPAMKWFPADAMGGVEGFKALLAPFKPVRLLPTGGIELKQIPDYLNAGALAVGLGSALISPQVLANRDADTLTKRLDEAKFYIQAAIDGTSSAVWTE